MFPAYYFDDAYFPPPYFSRFVIIGGGGFDLETIQILPIIYTPFAQSMIYDAYELEIYYLEQELPVIEGGSYPSIIYGESL